MVGWWMVLEVLVVQHLLGLLVVRWLLGIPLVLDLQLVPSFLEVHWSCGSVWSWNSSLSLNSL